MSDREYYFCESDFARLKVDRIEAIRKYDELMAAAVKMREELKRECYCTDDAEPCEPCKVIDAFDQFIAGSLK